MGIARELRFEFSAMVFSSGIILTLFVINHYALGGSEPGSPLPGVFQDIDRGIGAWIVWVVVVGPLLLLIGGWYFIDTIRKRREFERLMDTDSKAKFVRNLNRLERLAWTYLGLEYHRRVLRRKKEFNIR